MGLSWYRIKKWYRMLSGKSILHVHQDIGKHFSTTEVLGYYNNMKEKVTRMLLPIGEIPMMELETSEGKSKTIIFSTAVFQYGLGAYDLFLESEQQDMRTRFLTCAQWAVDNQHQNGGWNTFDFCDSDAPFSSMSTGEGISLLVRAYKETLDIKFLKAAGKAFSFIIQPIDKGGVSKISQNKLYLYEYTNKPLVLNGAIFAFWGIWDYYQLTKDPIAYNMVEMANNAIVEMLPSFDLGFWSKYDIDNKIASPFYHRLHIAQLEAMYLLTKEPLYLTYLKKWKNYESNKAYKAKAFIMKACQKLSE